MEGNSAQVSVVTVDACDRVIGRCPVAHAHDGEGVLHRGVSVFLWNNAGELLLQRRSARKRLWPLVWSNSCCGHPLPEETCREAAIRRANEELGINAALCHLFSFSYLASDEERGIEREWCHVFGGVTQQTPVPNLKEVAEVRFIKTEDLERRFAADPGSFTPWFILEWIQIRKLSLGAYL